MTASTSDWTCPGLAPDPLQVRQLASRLYLTSFRSKDSFFKGQVHTILEIITLTRRLDCAKHRLHQKLRKYPQTHRSHLLRQSHRNRQYHQSHRWHLQHHTGRRLHVFGRHSKSHRLLELPCTFPQHQAPY